MVIIEKIFENLQFHVLSEISRDIAQVFFAGVFIGPIISHDSSIITVTLGLTLSMFFWIVSITIYNKQNL